MSKSITQVAIFDGQLERKSERIAIQRRVDEVIFVYPFKDQESAQTIIKWYKKMGIEILAVPIDPNDFQSALSQILEAIDDYCLDDQIIEFNVACQNTILTIAACFAAMTLLSHDASQRSGASVRLSPPEQFMPNRPILNLLLL